MQIAIAGGVLEADYFESLKVRLEELGLAGQIRFLGSVSAMRPHLEAADLFVLPSRSEGFSNAIIEAMAYGLPVVATRVGGNDEAVEQGVTGYIVDSEDPAGMARAMLSVLGNAGIAESMGRLGRQRVAERFTTEAMMRRTAAAYDRLLADS